MQWDKSKPNFSGWRKTIKIFILIHFLTRCDVYSLDPTRLLLTLGACSGAQDKFYGNTALHWAIKAKNHVAVNILVMSGADLHIPNNQVHFIFIYIYISTCIRKFIVNYKCRRLSVSRTRLFFIIIFNFNK